MTGSESELVDAMTTYVGEEYEGVCLDARMEIVAPVLGRWWWVG